jgi:hypothetical protein
VNSVAPRGSSQARSAAISACGWPARSWNPSATTSPLRAITQPTIGFGLTE